MRERAEQKGLAPGEAPVLHDPTGPVADTPALFALSPPNDKKAAKKGSQRDKGATASQLPLPLSLEQDTPHPPSTNGKGRKRSKGFVPVTRDPDVARSYSDNVAYDYAVARGLAQALQSLPPEELAALRAKVAKAAQHTPKTVPARSSG